MAAINKVKDKILDLQLQYSPQEIKTWRGITKDWREVKAAYIESMEQITEKSHEELLDGSSEQYSYARNMVVEKNDLMEVLGIGPSAFAYRKTRLDPIRKQNGQVDMNIVKKKYKELCKDRDVILTKQNALIDSYTNSMRITSDQLILEPELCKFFPGATEIYKVKGTNIIYICADFINIKCHTLEYVVAYDHEEYWQFQKENMLLNENTQLIYEQILEYRKRCGYEILDNIKFSEWIHSSRNTRKNYYYSIADLTIGGQFYISECINAIQDEGIRTSMKNAEISTLKCIINPLTDFVYPLMTRTEKIKYIENIEYQMHVEHEDQYIRSMREDGILK